MKTTETPKYQNYHIPGVLHISPMDAFETIKEGKAILLDVRENNEYHNEKLDVEEIMFLPISRFMENFVNIPKEKPVIVVCASGVRSVQVVNFLKQKGYDNVFNLDGGNYAMKSGGLPYVKY
jgi:rhodanese-related sulfurtransferase